MRELPTGTVTFLFSDIEKSTQLLARLGDRYATVLEDHQRLLREAFRSHGGVEVLTEGDSFFVVFPKAAEALLAAVDAQRGLATHGWPEDEEIRVRMGMHTGEGILGGDSYVGMDIHRAARISSAAHGGQVLVSEATRGLVAHALPQGVTLRDLGDHRLKDLAHPEHLFQLVVDGIPSDFPPVRSLEGRPSNLPGQLTSFVGRRRQVEEVRELLDRARLVTLTGPGGTGKTRLSLEVARELLPDFDDGVFFVPLASITDPDLVLPTITAALGLREEPNRPPIDSLIEHLASKRLLLVLDNFEQVVAAAPNIGSLLGAAENVSALVTSRETLRLGGEQEYAVPPLSLPDVDRLPPPEVLSQYEAVWLFIERARAVRPEFAVTNENAPAVAQICARLDGLPLAIELAAARVRLFTPEAILTRLEHRLELLSGGARDLPARQQTLRGAIAWSFDLLDDEEQRFFTRLAPFRGGFTLEAAEAVAAGAELDALTALDSLVGKSLARQIETDRGEPRFLLLETIREYAEERLAEDRDEDRSARRRHAEHFLELVNRARGELTRQDQARWLDMLEEEHDNLRAALVWGGSSGEIETALRLGGGLWRYWQMRGHLREAAERLRTVLELDGVADHPEAHADALEAAGGVFYWMGRWPEAERFYTECMELRRPLGDRAALAEAIYNLSFVWMIAPEPTRDLDRSRALLEEALEIFEGLDDSGGRARVLWGLSNLSQITNRWEETIERATVARELFRELGDRFNEGWSLNSLGVANAGLGRFDEARALMREGLELFAGAGDVTGIGLLLGDFSILASLEGRYERAALLRGAALQAERRSGQALVSNADTYFPWTIDVRRGAMELESWDRLIREGAELSMDEAIALALKEE